MTIPEAIGCLLLFTVITIIVLSCIQGNRSLSYRELFILLVLAMAAILILVYSFDPRETIRFDLNEHYKTLKMMQKGGLKYAFEECEYKRLYVTVIYFYLISLTNNFHLLPVFPVMIEYMIFIYFLFDVLLSSGRERLKFSDIGGIIYVWFTCYGLMLAITGIRCVCAVTIAVLALYRDYVKEKRDVLTFLFYLIPIFIHSFALIVIATRILTIMKRKKLITGMLTVGILVGPVLIERVFSRISIPYVQYTLSLILKYWSSMNVLSWARHVSNSTRTIYICFVGIVFFAIYMVHQIKMQEELLNEEEKRILSLGTTVAYLGIIMLFNFLFLERYMYLLSYVLVMILSLFQKYVKKSLNHTLVCLFSGALMLWMFFFHDLYIFLVNATGIYFLAL